jgi:acetylornithine deacetylase/succinyl-diaminopimelate desuccinylase-like protein
MFNFEKFKDHAKRVLSIPSHAESGNEELVRYLHSLMHDFGFKPQLQQVNHSIDRLSKRQYNLIGYSSDALVDRTTRRGVLFVNPIDVTTGNLSHLWTSTQGNPHAPVLNEKGIIGAGAVQGKLDFLCRIYAATELLDKRHKNPIYLVGVCGSHYGMLGSRFMIESLSVNPKEVFSFAPTDLIQCKQSPGQISYTVDVDSSARDRDSRGYNRSVELTAYGVSVDFSTPENAINAFDLLMDLLLDAASNGFDFQWSSLETKGAEGANPDLAKAQIYLTAFQFEDFKQFIRAKLDTEEKQRFFRIEYTGVSEAGTSFIPNSLIEVILELEYEWKNFIKQLNEKMNPAFNYGYSVGTLTRVRARGAGKLAVTFEVRYLPNHAHQEVDEKWKSIVLRVSEKHKSFHFNLLRDYLVQGVRADQAQTAKNTNYLSDAGWFDKAKFPVSIIGAGNVNELPKGPNEAILWNELEKAISTYRDLMQTVSN